jgi:hypothetical protein
MNFQIRRTQMFEAFEIHMISHTRNGLRVVPRGFRDRDGKLWFYSALNGQEDIIAAKPGCLIPSMLAA